MNELLAVELAALAVLQIAWCIVYATGAWRSTPLGWVWLLKGGCLAVLWPLLLVDNVAHIPDAVFAVVGAVLIVATGIWLAVTVRARFGRFEPYL